MSRLSLLIFVTLGCATPVAAEPQPLDVDPQADWVHEPTGLNFPARIRDLARDRIVSYLADENNIGATYFTADDSEILSVYVYRAASYDVSMMADAAMAAVSSNDRLGTIDTEGALFSTFGDEAIGKDSGVLASFPVDGPYRSTALALFRSGNWLIKLRLSSKQVDAQTLDKRLALLASGLPLTPPPYSAPPAYRLADCETAPARGQVARRDLSTTDWIIATTVISISYDESVQDQIGAKTGQRDTRRLCRDARSKPGRMFYREAERGEPSAIVFGDSGTVASVGTADITLDKKTPPPVILAIGNGMKTEFFQGFESIPGFDQMMQVLEKGRVTASVERTPEGSAITLPPPD
ncbi:hypothetical protein AAJ72_07905 [Citromicrobium sp. RCC1885]|uniref:hypothetical protein n=1 Tax=unclassified Citromicrobium TaxID=2630544 RepID=UPI0006C8F246|nr:MULTISPECIES: hypothetical protein [unclassified Citromicrobium]KPM25549.1 hypothetical protein AAJ72_07905 [Citromicrobium sp. RCC1885]KPM28791.1 hypothetical protein AAJ74_08645 [Citromicrobium sp. RCC1878]OAM09659.1 hypothetical protein A0U43_00770 [Citromicrobium sp. RCC1897]|tara:strand:+ start:2930 stop:3985 length:1056 start_codon:yes stop_codon:yes gene_type:complete